MATVADIVPAPGINQVVGPIGIAPPPDRIFKFRKNRQKPAQDVWGTGTITYAPCRAEYIEGEGNFVYYYGVELPSKTIAPVEAIYAINGVKRITMNVLRLLSVREAIVPLASLLFIGKKRRGRLLSKALQHFNHIADTMVLPFYLEDGYYCKIVKEVRAFIRTFLIEMGVEWQVADKSAEIFGMMFEYDNAYRWPLQDMLSESSLEKLNNFPKEVKRLLELQKGRVALLNSEVPDKFKSGAKLLTLAWWIPSVRRALKNAFKAVNFENCRPDKADIYHTLLFADYNMGGKTQAERLKMYAEIHGEDQSKWPPRIMIRSTG